MTIKETLTHIDELIDNIADTIWDGDEWKITTLHGVEVCRKQIDDAVNLCYATLTKTNDPSEQEYLQIQLAELGVYFLTGGLNRLEKHLKEKESLEILLGDK